MSIISALRITRAPATAFVVVGMFWGCFAANVPVIKGQLGANDGAFGLMLLGSAIGLVSAMWIAPKVDKRLGGRTLQFGTVALAFMWLWPGLITSGWLFPAVMVLVGLASGLLDVSMNARVSEVEARTGRSLMNANHAMFSAAYAVSAVLTGLAREAGWSPIMAFASFGVISMLLLPTLKTTVEQVETPPEGRGTYPLWPILLCGAVVLVAFMSEATVEAWSALHVERTLGGGAAEGALGPAMLGFTMTIGRFSGQVVAEKMREVTVVFWASILSASGAIIAAMAPTPLVAYIGFGTLGLGVSVIGPMGLALVGKLVAPHLRTEAISRAAVMGFSGFFFAPVLMGLISQAFGLRIAFACVAALLLCAVPLSLVLRRLRRPGGAEARA